MNFPRCPECNSNAWFPAEFNRLRCSQCGKVIAGKMTIDDAVVEIEKIMMYRRSMPEEGMLREVLENLTRIGK